jgi:hypothetical protein
MRGNMMLYGSQWLDRLSLQLCSLVDCFASSLSPPTLRSKLTRLSQLNFTIVPD